jgi:hypothetical protein
LCRKVAAEGHLTAVTHTARLSYHYLISSGNQTSAHTRENGCITFMFCSFDEKPAILRLYGHGRAVLPGTPD